MKKSQTHVEEIRNFAFTSPQLSLPLDTTVTYTIASNNKTRYNSLYQPKNRFFILFIEEADKESPPLYKGDSFDYKFKQPGTYSVYCHNYPRIRQTVIIGDGDSTSVSDGLSRQSIQKPTCLFMESEESGFEGFGGNEVEREDWEGSRTGEVGLMDIGSCLGLIRDGGNAKDIKNKFLHVFEKNEKKNITNKKKEKNKKKQKESGKKTKGVVKRRNNKIDKESCSIAENRFNSTFEGGKEEFEFVDSDKYDLYKVHQLNKMSPNNLFLLLNRLKSECIDNQGVDPDFKVFRSFDDLAVYSKKKYPKKQLYSNIKDRKEARTAFELINDRFK